MKSAGLSLFAAVLTCAAAEPRLWYSKDFPGSQPAYMEIALEKNGSGVYKEAPDDDLPVKFELSPADAEQIFGLAGKLGYFNRPVESGLKVARMGTKTFRFEDGTRRSEVKFNYSEDPDAKMLLDWFERIAETEQDRILLERTAKYDKLGVNSALLLLQASMERNKVVAPRQMLPTLDRIVKDQTYLHMARLRAAGLADSIRASAK